MANYLSPIGVSLTLTANTATNLRTAVAAITGTDSVNVVARSLTLQADISNTAAVLVGDASVATTRIGYSLTIPAVATGVPPGELRLDSAGGAQVPLSDIWLVSTGTNQKVNVLIFS